MTDPSNPSPYSSHVALIASLNSQHAKAWEMALYEREQADKFTSQIRFGLVAGNAASLLTILNIGKSISWLSYSLLVFSCIVFLLGTVAAGCALIFQQSALVEKASLLNSRAQYLEMAASLSQFSPQSVEFDAAQTHLTKANDNLKAALTLRTGPIWMQNCAIGCWLSGAAIIALPAVAQLICR